GDLYCWPSQVAASPIVPAASTPGYRSCSRDQPGRDRRRRSRPRVASSGMEWLSLCPRLGSGRCQAIAKPVNQRNAIRPGSKAGRWIQVSDWAKFDQRALPAARELGRTFEAAEWIVAARRQDAREW